MATAGQVLPLVFDWPVECGDQAPGNILARRLRYIFEDTNGLFPPSRKESRAVAGNGQIDKYNSTYEMDFNGRYWDRKEFRAPRPASEMIKKRSKLVRPERRVNSSTVFMNWKIPKRALGLPENGESQTADERRADRDDSSKDEEKEAREEYEISTKFPALSPRAPIPPPTASGASVPPLLPTRLPTPPESPCSSSPRRAARRADSQLGSFEAGVLHPAVVPRAAELLRHSGAIERRIIEKALLAGDRTPAPDAALSAALQPEAAAQVKKWLETAPSDEKEIVLKFFNSLAGNKRTSPAEEEKKELVFKVMEMLKRGRASYVSQSHPNLAKGNGLTALQHMRLAPPGARRSQLGHATWHPLPPQGEKELQNVSSHFGRPQLPVPRHFTIHPDWGS